MGKRTRQSELPMLGVLFIAGGFFAGAAVAQPSINVSTTGTGSPGGTATFSVTLATNGAQVAGTINDITFDPNTPVAATSGSNCAITTSQTCTSDAGCPVLPTPFNICVGGTNNGNTCTADGDCTGGACSHEPCLTLTGTPECTTQLTGKQGFFSFLPHLCVGGSNAGNTCSADSECTGGGHCTGACTPGTNCTGIRAIIIAVDNLDPITDGSALYSCTVAIASGAAEQDYTLTISNESAGGTNQALIPGVTGTNGKITVGPPSGVSFVVCDVFPVPGTGGAPFGDGNIRNADIKSQLTMLGSAATSDIQKAADAFPVDNPATCGGDGNIRNADVKTCLTYLGGKSFVRTLSDSTCSSAAQP